MKVIPKNFQTVMDLYDKAHFQLSSEGPPALHLSSALTRSRGKIFVKAHKREP